MEPAAGWRARVFWRAWLPWIALGLWMLGIFLFSAQPGDDSEVSSDAFVTLLQSLGLGVPTETLSFLVRKAAHSFAYFGLGLITFAAFGTTRLRAGQRAAASLALVALYAISDEVHQLFVPGRSGEARDVLIDTVAGAIAIAIAAAITAKRARDPRTADRPAGRGDPSP